MEVWHSGAKTGTEMSIEQAKEVLKIEAEGILAILDQVGPDFDRAVDLIMACPSRIILAGIGKSGIICQKIAATLNSTGTASFFLHPVEAMHGDLGIVDSRDVVLAISYSGETAELNLLANSLKNRGVAIIAMTGNLQSTLAKLADAVLNVAVPKEACPLGLAPTASTTGALAMGDALAVVLLERKQFRECDFRRNHPGGSLGERLKVNVSEVMITGEHIPMVGKDTLLRQAVAILNTKNLGAVLIVDEEKRVAGIITDGDIRRMVAKDIDLDTQQAADYMTPAPKTISEELLAADALSIMQEHEITILPITDAGGHLAGILHLHDLLGKGEFRFLV
jgi:arabinose-5-phosphate isomerase